MSRILYRDLGQISYAEAWDYQEKLFQPLLQYKFKKRDNPIAIKPDQFVLFCEHPHVYTLGKSGDQANLLFNEAFLASKGATFFKTNRGGDITYHGPGQIVGYPIIDLEDYGVGVREYIDKLEESIIIALKDYGINGCRLEGATGVWLDPETPGKARKICAIGVKVSRHISMHGFAFNVNTDLNYFDYINPCGFTDKQVTSVQKELGRKINMEEIKTKVLQSMESVFGFKLLID